MLLDSCSGGGGRWVCTARVWNRRRFPGSLTTGSLLRPSRRVAAWRSTTSFVSSSITRSVSSWIGGASSPDHASSIGSTDRRPDRPPELQRSAPRLLPDRARAPARHRDDRDAGRSASRTTPVFPSIGSPSSASSPCPPGRRGRPRRARARRRRVERGRSRVPRPRDLRAPRSTRPTTGIRTAPLGEEPRAAAPRSIASPFVSGSRYEMWLHATIAGPLAGIRLRGSVRRRNQNHSGGRTTALATWYQGSVAPPRSEVVRVPRRLG